MEKSKLFNKIRVGELDLANRLIMAPMTRLRANEDGSPNSLMARYYAQRATSGLIIAEGTYPREGSAGYIKQPGAVTEKHFKGWKKVIERVHENNGKIVIQLMDAGSLAIKEKLNEITPQGPTEIKDEKGIISKGMNEKDIEEVIERFVIASQELVKIGADGIEIHAANGYLLHQFLDPKHNKRKDSYGFNSNEPNKIIIELLSRIKKEVKMSILGVRISPEYTGFVSPKLSRTVHRNYIDLVKKIEYLDIDYISISPGDLPDNFIDEYRSEYSNIILLNSKHSYGETDKEEAERIINSGLADGVIVGRKFIANPNLVEKWEKNIETNRVKYEYLYSGGGKGYIDYE